jgi:GxxExxY protein
MTNDELNALTKRVLSAAFQVHTALGPGLLESAYTACLVHELRAAGLEIRTEVPVPVMYKGLNMSEAGFRIDILVEAALVVEVKSLDRIAPVHLSQLITYLKLSDRRLGLLLNFNVASFKDGIYRRVHRF